VIDEGGLKAYGPPRGAVAVLAQAGSTTAATTRGAIWDDEIDRDRKRFSPGGRHPHPRPRLRTPRPRLEQAKARVTHRRLELRLVADQRRVECQVAVRRVRSDSDVSQTRAQVDGLSSGDDHGSPVRCKCLECVKKNTPRGDVAALLVAKAHKIHDRLSSARPGRVEDKDAADVYRLMQTTSPAAVGEQLGELRGHVLAGPATDAAVRRLADLFGRRGGEGVRMAVRALRLAIPEAQVVTLSTSYVERMRAAIAAADIR
jgi:hypothetical protein